MLRKLAGKEPRVSLAERSLRILSLSTSRGGGLARPSLAAPALATASRMRMRPAATSAAFATAAAAWTGSGAASPQENNGGQNVPVTLTFRAHAASIPHPQKVYKGGEDASFVSDDGRAMGVFDGVGAWSEMGIDPGLYSKSLAARCKAAYESMGGTSPSKLLETAWTESQHIQGSSTACAVTIVGSTLRGANIGDSGFLVVRNGGLLYRQKEQQHSFNFPFQLGSESCDSPSDADLVELEVQAGDVVVAATDGVLDNLFPKEIVAIVSEGLTLGKTEVEIADRIAQMSFARSNARSGTSPFSVAAQAANWFHVGGKPDDITCVVGIIEAKPQVAMF